MAEYSEMRKIAVRDLAQCPFLDGEFGSCTLPDGPGEWGDCTAPPGAYFPTDCPLKSEGAIVVHWAPLITMSQPSKQLEGV